MGNWRTLPTHPLPYQPTPGFIRSVTVEATPATHPPACFFTLPLWSYLNGQAGGCCDFGCSPPCLPHPHNLWGCLDKWVGEQLEPQKPPACLPTFSNTKWESLYPPAHLPNQPHKSWSQVGNCLEPHQLPAHGFLEKKTQAGVGVDGQVHVIGWLK